MKIKQNILVAGFFISIILLTGCFIQAKPETSELESTTEETPRVFLENISPTVTDKTVLTDEEVELTITANQSYTPVQVSKEDMEQRITELKDTYPSFSDRELAALLVANCSYMEPEVFNTYVTTHFETTYTLMNYFREYQMYKTTYSGYEYVTENTSANYLSLVPMNELFFDPYLIYQASEFEKNIYAALIAWENDHKANNVYIFFYNYLMYNNVDDLLFLRGDTRIEGNGLLVIEYIVDDYGIFYLYDFNTKYPIEISSDGSTLFEPAELIPNITNSTLMEHKQALMYAESTTLTDLERLIVDEVNRIINLTISENNTVTSES